MKPIYVVFQHDLSDHPLVCGIYANKDASKECIAAAEKVGLHRWSEMHVIQTEYDLTKYEAKDVVVMWMQTFSERKVKNA